LGKKHTYGKIDRKTFSKVNLALTSFWNEYNTKKTPEDKLDVLTDYVWREFRVYKGKDLLFRRKAFLSDPSLSLAKNSFCSVCGATATERHHIIPLKNGGINTEKNIIPICKSCHSLVHPWLAL